MWFARRVTATKMGDIRKKRILLLPVVISAVAVLLVLALLQYRWTSQLSDAEEMEMGTNLESLMLAWHLDFYYEFSAISAAFEDRSLEPGEARRNSYMTSFAHWKQGAEYPGLISDLLILDLSGGHPQLLRLDLQTGRQENYRASESLQPLLSRLEANSSGLDVALDAWKLTEPATDKDSSELRNSSASAAWLFDQNLPALVHPILNSGPQPASTAASRVNWIIVILDRGTIQDQIVPGLTRRYFGAKQTLEYDATFKPGNTLPPVIYYAQPQPDTVRRPDAVMNIFGPVPESTEGHFWRATRIASSLSQHSQFTAPVWFPVIRYSSWDGDWNLVLQRRGASFSSVLQSNQRRNMALGFGTLLLLGLSVGLVFLASKRAEQLAQMQMNFVASVSHDLRTPLSVIRTATENLAAGVVSDQQQLAAYAVAIRNQTLQLTNLIEQVLLFASTSRSDFQFVLRPTSVVAVIESALGNTSGLIGAAGVEVEKRLEANLPEVMADPSMLSRAIQNLLINAIHYGGNGKITVQAHTGSGASTRGEVAITVQDQGPGIAEAELARIFEPFYRSAAAMNSSVHGTGLGLALARNVVEMMGGRLTVASILGVGSSFTINLPPTKRDGGRAGVRNPESLTTSR